VLTDIHVHEIYFSVLVNILGIFLYVHFCQLVEKIKFYDNEYSPLYISISWPTRCFRKCRDLTGNGTCR
jgi:hypothetical protein